MPCEKKSGLRVIRILFRTTEELTRSAVVVFATETDVPEKVAPNHPVLKKLSISEILSLRESDELNLAATRLFTELQCDMEKLPIIQEFAQLMWDFRDGNNFR